MTIRDEIVEYLNRGNTPNSQVEIATAIGRSSPGVSLAIKKLREEGIMESDSLTLTSNASTTTTTTDEAVVSLTDSTTVETEETEATTNTGFFGKIMSVFRR